jgi:hypothetical protein
MQRIASGTRVRAIRPARYSVRNRYMLDARLGHPPGVASMLHDAASSGPALEAGTLYNGGKAGA